MKKTAFRPRPELSGGDVGWIDKSQAREVGWILLAVPFVLQIIGSVFSYLARDGAIGAAVGVVPG